MAQNYIEEDAPDNDPTDELPILTDVVLTNALGPTVAVTSASSDDDTGQFEAPAHQTRPQAAARDDYAAALQRDLADRDVKLGTLEEELAGLATRWRATRDELIERDAELAGLRAALAERDAERTVHAEADARTHDELQAREQRIAELSDEIDALRTGTAALEDNARVLEQQIVELESTHKAALEQAQSAPESETIARLREENAALAQHIENRNLIWREQAATVEEKLARVRELELELDQRLERQQAAERHAETEANQVNEYRAKLTAMAAALENAQRDSQVPAPVAASNAPEVAADAAAMLRQELQRAVALQVGAGESPEELKRLEELEAAIRQLELEMDAAAVQPPADTERQHEPAQLICLTAEELGPYELDGAQLVIGRGSHCGIRITTHYVSREHARIIVADGRYLIEDAGSRNGVFVNSVRVERQELADNDLITIGDTQFRYQAGSGR